MEEIDAFGITKDGCCAAKRPGNEKKNKKWKPDCAIMSNSAKHPFKKPKDYFAHMDAAEDALGPVGGVSGGVLRNQSPPQSKMSKGSGGCFMSDWIIAAARLH